MQQQQQQQQLEMTRRRAKKKALSTPPSSSSYTRIFVILSFVGTLFVANIWKFNRHHHHHHHDLEMTRKSKDEGETASMPLDASTLPQQLTTFDKDQLVELKKNILALNNEILAKIRVEKGLMEINQQIQAQAQIQAQIQAQAQAQAHQQPQKNQKITSQPRPWNEKVAIFFNTFQQFNNTQQANKIITQQLQQINQQPLLSNSTIYYTRLGDITTLPFPIQTCTNHNQRTCHELYAQEQGGEVLTLQSVFEYCSNGHNSNDMVIYIHSKGSFTPTKENDVLRDILMKAVLSQECLEMNMYNPCTASTSTSAAANTTATATTTTTNNHDNTQDERRESCCDTCSSQFHGVPAHYPGNMWLANCDYVSKLIPPKNFAHIKQTIINQVKNATTPILPITPNKTNTNTNAKQFQTKLLGVTFQYRKSKSWMLESPSMLGIGRFAMEQWIGGHPHTKPCHVFSPKNKNDKTAHNHNNNNNNENGIPIIRYGGDTLSTTKTNISAQMLTPKLEIAPGINFREFWMEKGYKLHPWFEKVGREMESKLLYDTAPDSRGWFYKFWDDTN
jgi:hypothetical protein